MAEVGRAILNVFGLVVLDVVLLAGLLAIPIGLGGNFIILGAALLVALITGFARIGWVALILMAVFVAVGELLEAFLGSMMARKYGASGYGMTGAFVGGIAGAIVGTSVLPLVGTIIGSILGTAVGAVLAERLRGASEEDGTRAGWGALIGRTLASLFKLAIGIGMVIHVVAATHGGGG